MEEGINIHIIAYGEMGSGKSALLILLKKALEDAGYKIQSSHGEKCVSHAHPNYPDRSYEGWRAVLTPPETR